MNYNYLIVGSGLTGAVLARELTNKGKKVLVIDKRSHIGGNCHTRTEKGIPIHCYGPHQWHCRSKRLHDYISKYTTVNHFILRVKARVGHTVYSLPVNLATFQEIYGASTPADALQCIQQDIIPCVSPQNAEEWLLAHIGKQLTNLLYKPYSEKQWERPLTEIPAYIVQRLPIRFTWDDRYFDDEYQGILDYDELFSNLLADIEVKLQTPYENQEADRVIYTGPIDELLGYRYGPLEWRSLRFEHEWHDGDYQGTAQMNYPDAGVPFTRIIEHKHFYFMNLPYTVITKEYPQAWDLNKEPYYPLPSSQPLYEKYLADLPEKFIACGRLGGYKYINQDIAVSLALDLSSKLLDGTH